MLVVALGVTQQGNRGGALKGVDQVIMGKTRYHP
jgi:hypothetical protein